MNAGLAPAVRLSHPLDKYLRTDRIPHLWCPGCTIGTALQAFLRAVYELEAANMLDHRSVVFVSGIGCTGRAPLYVKLDGAHTPHGRAIPYATGVKLANPKLNVVVFSGDGDLAGIGGNHLIHAARRNMDLCVILINNMIYALTGGQVAPTTPSATYTTTTPWGNPERELNIAKLIAQLNVNYVARWSVAHSWQLKESIKKALLKRGFRFIEVMSSCPEIFGRHIGYRNPFELYDRLRKVTKVRKVSSFDEILFDWNSEITCGEFVDQDLPGFVESLQRACSRITSRS